MEKKRLLANKFIEEFRSNAGLTPKMYYIVEYDTISMLYYAVDANLYLTLAAGDPKDLANSNFDFKFPLGEISSNSPSGYTTLGTTKLYLGGTTTSLSGLKSLTFDNTTTLDLDINSKLKSNKSIYSYEDISAFGKNDESHGTNLIENV